MAQPTAPPPREHDRANAKPAQKPDARPGPEPSPDAPAGASPEFSTTAVREAIAPPRPEVKPEDRDVKAAQAKLAPLQKQYDETLAKIQQTPDPLARAQLVVLKG